MRDGLGPPVAHLIGPFAGCLKQRKPTKLSRSTHKPSVETLPRRVAVSRLSRPYSPRPPHPSYRNPPPRPASERLSSAPLVIFGEYTRVSGRLDIARQGSLG